MKTVKKCILFYAGTLLMCFRVKKEGALKLQTLPKHWHIYYNSIISHKKVMQLKNLDQPRPTVLEKKALISFWYKTY